jgi:hypothetical protein
MAVKKTFSRYWWSAYLSATDETHAYAAWLLFLQTSDRYDRPWLHHATDMTSDRSRLLLKKMAHAKVNRSAVKESSENRRERLDESNGVGPWGIDRW